MMAAGCIPVDLYRYNNLMDHKRGTVLLAYQDSDSIAEALASILDDSGKAERMSGDIAKYAASRTLDWEMDVIANCVLAMTDGKLPPFSDVKLMYSDSPILARSSRRPGVERFCQMQRAFAEFAVKTSAALA